MSLLDKLTDSKKNLKSTETKFIQTDGSVFIESRSETGFAKIPTSDTSHGFIIDLKPDLQVAEILPWLFFGSQDVACDRSLLLQHRITHILSLGVNVPHFHQIQYEFMEVLDLPEFNILDQFDNCSLIIDRVREENGKILVHCNAGISRSSSVVIAYLMKYNSLSLAEALNTVKSARPCARPNSGFMKQLHHYENYLSESSSLYGKENCSKESCR
ncbi:unnamed protein product [Bemisia tabaci]|uniref:Tyrosine-protein phosphatase domain-containing protein n=1 Tax=Bemisia tabaci TaxID=7038 RepID=A0A9P0F0F1_BEMTA|nr:unnamed protein product [Bemisia tabaci]